MYESKKVKKDKLLTNHCFFFSMHGRKAQEKKVWNFRIQIPYFTVQ